MQILKDMRNSFLKIILDKNINNWFKNKNKKNKTNKKIQILNHQLNKIKMQNLKMTGLNIKKSK
jgi:hypothetical protein